MTIEDQKPVTVLLSTCGDVAWPYARLGWGRHDGGPVFDVWLTVRLATALGHYLLALGAQIGCPSG